MKKVFTLTAIFLLGLTTLVQAQFILGGNLGFSSQKETYEPDGDEIKVSNINLIPRLGYAFGDFWAGLDVGLSSIKVEDDDSEFKVNTTSISPFLRYINKPADNVGIWLEGQAGFAFGKAEDEEDDLAKISALNIGIRPGVIFFIGDHLSFEASFGRLGFSQTTVSDPDDSDIKTKTSNLGLSLNSNSIDLNSLQYFDEPFSLAFSSGFLLGVNWSFGGGGGDK